MGTENKSVSREKAQKTQRVETNDGSVMRLLGSYSYFAHSVPFRGRTSLLKLHTFAAPDCFVDRFYQFNCLVTVIRGNLRFGSVQDAIDERGIFLEKAAAEFFLVSVERMRLEICVCTLTIKHSHHFLGNYCPVMAENLDAFEGEQPARIA